MILIDAAIWPAHGRLWCHVVSDTTLEELHAFAKDMGIPDRGFEGDHYDLPDEMRERALQLGAREVSSRELVNALYAAGMRRQPGTDSSNIAS